VESVKARSKTIHKECMLFGGCYARVLRSKRTGVSPGDIIRMATGVFNGIDMNNASDDCGKPFKCIDAWEVLRKHEKFMVSADGRSGGSEPVNMAGTSEKEDHSSPGASHNVITGDAKTVTLKDEIRPPGRKRAKDLLQRQRDSAKKLRLAAE